MTNHDELSDLTAQFGGRDAADSHRRMESLRARLAREAAIRERAPLPEEIASRSRIEQSKAACRIRPYCEVEHVERSGIQGDLVRYTLSVLVSREVSDRETSHALRKGFGRLLTWQAWNPEQSGLYFFWPHAATMFEVWEVNLLAKHKIEARRYGDDAWQKISHSRFRGEWAGPIEIPRRIDI